MAQTFRLTLSSLDPRGAWLTRIRGPDSAYGLNREFVKYGHAVQAKNSVDLVYDLREPGHYEACRTQLLPGVTKVRTYLSLSQDFKTLTELKPEELFKTAAFEHTLFGWSAWFGRLFSPHLVSRPLEIHGQVGVGERWFLHRDGNIATFMTVAVPFYFEDLNRSIIQVCPIEKLGEESLSTLLMTAHPLAERLMSGDLQQLPRGDWGGENAPA